MRHFLFGFIFVGIAASAVAQMLTQPSAESDALFAAGVDLYYAGKYREAIPLFAKSDSLDKAQIDPSSNRRDYSSMWLASCYYKRGDTATAAGIDAYYRFVPVDRRLTVKSDSLSQIGMEYANQGDYAKAVEYLTQCAEIEKSVVGDKHIWYGNTISLITYCYFQLGDSANFLKHQKLKVDVLRYTDGKCSEKYVAAITDLGILYHQLSLYQDALSSLLEAYDLSEKLDKDRTYLSFYIASEYNSIVMSGLSDDPLDCLLKSRSYLEETFKSANPTDTIINSVARSLYVDVEQLIASSLLKKADDLGNDGNYKEALNLSAEALSICEKVLGKENVGYATSLGYLAKYNHLLGNTTEAVRLGTEALGIAGTVLGKDSPGYALILNDLSFYHHALGNDEEAIPLIKEALGIREKAYGKEHSAYCAALCNLALYYASSENYADAIRIGTEAIGLCEKSFGKESTTYAKLLNDLSLWYKSLGDYDNAIILVSEALDIRERIFGRESRPYVVSLHNLAYCYESLGDYKKALTLGKEVVEIGEKVFGKEHPNYASDLSNLATYNLSLGNYAEAIRLERDALKIREKVFGKEHPDYATSLNNLALYNSKMGNYNEAIRLGTEALQIQEKVLGKEHPDYATSLSNLANCNYYLGNYSEAIRLETEALQIRKKVLGKEHPDYATPLSNLALYNSKMGNYNEAIRLGTEALQIQEKVLGKEHPDYATSLSNLAGYNSDIGNYAEAIRLGTEALQIREKVLGKEHPDYATSLNNLATYNSSLGNYAEAIRLSTEALQIRKKVFGKEHPDYATYLGNLANCNYYLGNYSEAIRLGTEALQIRKKVFGKEHPDYATSLSNLANYNSSLGNYAEAIRLSTEALNIYEKILGKEHPYYTLILSNLANYNYSLGNYAEAIRLGTEALQIQEKVLGKEHPYYALSLNNLADYNSSLGNYAEAIRLGTEALQIQEKVLGKEHPDYALPLVSLAVYNKLNRNADAIKYCVEATEALSGIVKRTFADLTARERNLFWEQYYKVWFEETIHSIAYDMPSDSLAMNGYNGALMAKGLLLNSEMELSTLLKESGDSEVANIYNSLKNLRLQINKLYEMPVAERPLDTDSLERAAQGLERRLVQRSKVYGDYTANLVIDWKQVRQRLGDGEMAVEFVSFPLRGDSVMYAAYCLRKDMPSPKMVPLFEERQLTGLNKGLYLSSDALYNLIWKPLESEMEGVKTVYFAPSGELYNLPIENLPVGEGTYNSDIRGYRRLSSTRQLALRRNGVEVAKAAVYGGLKYDTDTVTLANDSRKYRTAEPVQWSSRAVADSLNLRDGVYELPATKIEAEDIGKTLETAKINTELYTDTIGTEASFKALSGSGVNALHIATHGFYWTEREAVQLDNLAFLNTDMPTVVQEDKALTRSGLLLAGANTALKGLPLPDGVEDGVLTAKEIAGMDLRRLDLVALSACQTGLGEITGDGVFGLQRGFKKAGANTLLMSLWKVDDTATQLLMTQFYKNLLSGMGKYEALTAAQKYLRELEVEVKPEKTAFQQIMDGKDGKKEKNPGSRTVRKYANPYYWAAFVLLDGIN